MTPPRTVGGDASSLTASRLLLLVTAATLLGACAGNPFLREPPRFLPEAGSSDEAERDALMCREWKRAQEAPPFVRARILEALPALSSGSSHLHLAARCTAGVESTPWLEVGPPPLPFSRLLVARLRTVHGASFLLDLAELPEDAITPYQPTPEEPGPLPPKRLVRALALASIPVWWSAANQAEPQRRLFERLRSSQDDRELLMLHEAASLFLGSSPWGRFTPSEEAPRRELLRAWLTDLERRLLGPSERPSLELVLLRLVNLVDHGERLGMGPEVRALVERILAAKGEFPLTRGSPHAARDLTELARWMLLCLDVPSGSLDGFHLSGSRRERFDPRAELATEPAGGQATLEQRRSRLRDLEGELAGLRMYAARCYVLEELGRWLPAEDAPQRFSALTEPLRSRTVPWSTETGCRLRAALALEGVDEASQVGLLVTLLSTPSEAFGPRDRSGDPGGFYVVSGDSMLQVTARELARHLDWIERHAALRAWLDTWIRAPLPLDHEPAKTWALLQPAFERLLAFHLSGRPEARPEAAREILRAWMDSVRAAEGAPVGHVYKADVMLARLRALGEWGGRAGLTEEVAAFLYDREYWRAATVAAYLLTLPPPEGAPEAR